MIVPVAPVPSETGFAIAGDRVAYALSAGRTVTLRDSTGAVLGRVTVPPGELPEASVFASPQRIAMSVIGDDGFSEVFADGPLLQGTAKDFVGAFDVDGAHVFTAQIRSTFKDGFRWTVFAPGAAEAGIRVPRRAFIADFAGDRVAYSRGRYVVLANWRTGATIRRFRHGDYEDPFALRADGALAYVRDETLYRVESDGRRRRLAAVPGGLNNGVAWAGDRVIIPRDRFVVAVEPDGRVRRIGPRTTAVDGVHADGDTVAWTANGCLVRANVTDGPADAIGPGPCRRTEMDLDAVELRRRRVYLPCLAGPGGVCRVTVGRRAYRIPIGTARWLRRRSAHVPVRLVDPGGRRYPVYLLHGTTA